MLSSKENTLIQFLLNYYKNKIDLFKDIIQQKTPLSLRLLDWLVTNYSKKYNIIYNLVNEYGENVSFNIFLDYKNQLKARSSRRMNQSALFESIKFRKQWREDNQNEFLDLNLEERIKQKNKIEEFLLSNENDLRKKLIKSF